MFDSQNLITSNMPKGAKEGHERNDYRLYFPSFFLFPTLPPFHVPFTGWINIHDVVDDDDDDDDEGYDNGGGDDDDNDDDDDDDVEVNASKS